MNDWIVGILLILIGALFCFRGYLAMRFIIPIWGATAGFFLGAGLIASWNDEGFLVTILAWVVGIVLALIFGLLAYLYYEVAVFLAMGSIGFVLGATLMAALGVTWDWLIVLVGLAVGVLLAIFAIFADMPMALLTVLTATAGASAIVTGIMLFVGRLTLDDFDEVSTPESVIGDQWWWYAIYGGLAILGIVLQLQSTVQIRASLREAWAESGGREMRTA